MRFTLRLLPLVLTLWSYTLCGQPDLRVSYTFNDIPLAEALNSLSAQTNLTFSYADDLVAGQKITARANQLPLPVAMRRLLRSTPITFKIVRKRYVLLLPKSESSDLSIAPDKPVEKAVFRLRGTITDAGSGEGIPYATISVVISGSGGYSDLDGGFDLEVAAGPKDSVEFSSLGYQGQRMAIRDVMGRSINPKLALASVGLQDIVVTAYLTKAIRAGSNNGEIQFSPADIDLLPGQAEPDILQSLLLLPGVSSSTESVADVNIRGGTADQNLVLWDNIPVYHTGHYFGSFTAFNPFIVDEVNVWRSGFGAEYGGRVSGVIDIKTSGEITEEPRVGAGFNLTHAHVYGDVPLVQDKLSLLFSARRAFTDIFPTITFNNFRAKVFQGTKVEEDPEAGNEEISVTEDRFVFADMHSKLHWQPSAKDRVSVSLFTGSNDLLFGIGEEDVEITDNLGVENFGVSGAWDHQLNDRVSLNFVGTYSYFNYNSGYQEIASDQTELIMVRKRNELTDQKVLTTLNWQPSAENKLRAGISTERYALSFDLDYVSIFEPGVQEAVARGTDVHSAFVDYEFGKSESPFSGRLGLRSVLVTGLEELFWEPRLNLSYRFPSGVRLKANAGINHQFVNQLIEFEFNGLGVDNQIWTLVDGDAFPALRSVQFAAGLDWRQDGWFIDLEGYSRTLRGITSFTPQLTSFDPDEYSQGSGRSFGFDFLLRKQFGNHQTWVSYSLSANQYFFDEFSDTWIPAFNDQRHRISWTYLWQKDRWSLSLGWNFQSGKPYTPLASVVLDVIEDDDELDYLAFGELGPLNSARLPAYHRLDLSGLYTFRRKNNQGPTYQLGASLINVYGRENLVERRYLDVFYGNEEPEEVDVELFEKSLLGLTPNLFFRVEWGNK